MNLLDTPQISTDKFTWDAEKRRFIAEASELRKFQFGQVYDDACDVGFTLVSAHTGFQVRMVETTPIMHDGELVANVFTRASHKLFKDMDFEVHILND